MIILVYLNNINLIYIYIYILLENLQVDFLSIVNFIYQLKVSNIDYYLMPII